MEDGATAKRWRGEGWARFVGRGAVLVLEDRLNLQR
jgi:hypothetical protein